MKKTLLIAGVMSCFVAAQSFAQSIVGSNPEPRNVVLEEFSGIYCGYCPDGADRVNQIIATHPGRVVAVKFHSSDTYSEPNPGSGHPDFRTQWGSGMQSLSGLTGFPSGMVNRYSASGPMAMGRGQWAAAAADIINGGNSPVNVGIQTEWTDATRELKVTVQVYYTDNSQAGQFNLLNVALTENKLIGFQSDYGPHGNWQDYEHNETFRDFLTGQFGEQVTRTVQGNLSTFTFTTTVDASWNIDNMDVAAYVTEGNKRNIFTGALIAAKNAVGHSADFAAAPSTANAAVGIDENVAFTGVSVYPNPSNDIANINVNVNTATNVNVEVFNVIGEKVANPFNGIIQANTAKKIQFDTSDMTNGIYFVTVRSGDAVKTVKLNVSH